MDEGVARAARRLTAANAGPAASAASRNADRPDLRAGRPAAPLVEPAGRTPFPNQGSIFDSTCVGVSPLR